MNKILTYIISAFAFVGFSCASIPDAHMSGNMMGNAQDSSVMECCNDSQPQVLALINQVSEGTGLGLKVSNDAMVSNLILVPDYQPALLLWSGFENREAPSLGLIGNVIKRE